MFDGPPTPAEAVLIKLPLRGLISHTEATLIAERLIAGKPKDRDGDKLLRYIRTQEIAEVLRNADNHLANT